MKKNKGPTWKEDHYRKALKALRASGLYRDLDPAHGYDLRQGKKLSFGAKMHIRKLSVQLATINARPHAFVTPKNKSQEKKYKKSLGIKAAKLKKIPVPIVPNQPVKISIDSQGRIYTKYSALGLEQIISPLDLKTIARTVDYSAEEDEQRDMLAYEYFRAAVKAVEGLDDGDSFFRISSRSGDINPENYARTQFLEDLEEYFARLVNRYSDYDNGEVELLDFVSAISVWRRLKGDAWKRDQDKAAGTDFTKPIQIRVTKDGVKAKTARRKAVAKKKTKVKKGVKK